MIRSCKTQRVNNSRQERDLPMARLNFSYDLQKIIGHGTTANVWLATHASNPKQ